MNRPTHELLFDGLVLLAVGLAQASFLLGIGVEPYPTLVIGTVLVVSGVVTIVPPRTRVPAAITGLTGMVLAGAVVPIFAARAVRPGTTLWAALLLAGVVLLLTVAILRVTTFTPRATQPI
jgi:uncharacterized membrane protein HdeD (DUF308 family)